MLLVAVWRKKLWTVLEVFFMTFHVGLILGYTTPRKITPKSAYEAMTSKVKILQHNRCKQFFSK